MLPSTSSFSLWVKPLHPSIKALDIPLRRQTAGSAGVDLHSTAEVILHPQDRLAIHTGVAIWLEYSSLMGLIAIRSSWGKKGLVLQNSVGIIDSDYQGELLLQVMNLSPHLIHIPAMTRIAQLIVVQILPITANLIVEEFPERTSRATGGFGSTGN